MSERRRVATLTDNYGNELEATSVDVGGETQYHDVVFQHINTLLPTLNEFQSRSSDLWICTYPKSGTHWMHEMLWLLIHRCPSETLKESHMLDACQNIDDLDMIASSRILNTHIPFKYLPQQIKESKIVYVIRNPLSVALSYYHHNVNATVSYKGSPEAYIESFAVTHYSFLGSWFEHVTDAYRLSQSSSNILLLYYEEMLEDPSKAIKELSQFLGCEVSSDEVKKIVKQTSLQSMKGRYGNTKIGPVDYTLFTRKGEAAEWKSHVKQEFLEEFMVIYNSQLKDFPELKKRIPI